MRKAVATSPLLAHTDYGRELELEHLAITKGVARYRDMAEKAREIGAEAELKPGERLLLHWYPLFVDEIRHERTQTRLGYPGTGRAIYGPVLLAADADKVAVIAMHEALGRCARKRDGEKLATVAYAIGNAVIAQLHLSVIRRKKDDNWKQLDRLMERHRVKVGVVNRWARKTLEEQLWRRTVCTHMGVALLWLLIGVASTRNYTEGEEFEPVFAPFKKRVGKRTVGFVRLTDPAWRILHDGHTFRETLRPRYLPMIVPPLPWTYVNDDGRRVPVEGGYVHVRTPFVSKPTLEQRERLNDANLAETFDCLNALSSTPWRLNERMVELVGEAWKSGTDWPKLPPRQDLPRPEKPINPTEEELSVFKREWHFVKEENDARSAERLEFDQAIGVSEQFAGEPSIWFPHQLDFRGRCYPIPIHLSPVANDPRRSMLLFAEAKPVPANDPAILRHVANTWGKGGGANLGDLPFRDREQWVKDHWREIAQVAAAPLDTVDWWKQADDPWQFVAGCIAINDDTIRARLPVQQDGTCNGLQHYAALGRFSDDAEVVNLIASERPAGAYNRVADHVREIIAAEARQGSAIARIVLPEVDRDTVKQPFMTTVYGVTRAGARDQIGAKLRKRGVPEKTIFKVADFMAVRVLRSIGDICKGAASIMAWLQRIGERIFGRTESSRNGKKVVKYTRRRDTLAWTSPLGFPVVQPYRILRNLKVRTVLMELRIKTDFAGAPAAVKRNLQGFAPNFIHSIDAAHMLMTARACRAEGIAFGAVHDSFWTHAADAPRLARLLREQFVGLHERPLLADLHRELVKRHGLDLEPPPAPGAYDPVSILDAPYAFN